MEIGAITEYIDVAQIVLYVFWAFFFGLIFYLQRENRREGYPLEYDDGRLEDSPYTNYIPEPKGFRMAHGPHEVLYSGSRDTRDLNLEAAAHHPGTAYEPKGDPMADGLGAASYAERQDHVDFTVDGEAKIVPLRVANDYYPAAEDDDPRGMTVYGADGKAGGTVSDIWVDKSEYLARYLEVAIPDGGKVLLPMNLAVIRGPGGILAKLSGIEPKKMGVHVHSLNSDQFGGVPRTANPEQVTLLEEDKIMGYWGGGKLYATPQRFGPLV